MYWLLDSLVLLFAVVVAICGYRKGIVDALLSLLGAIILFALAVAGGAGILLLFYKVGAVNDLAYALLSVTGETNSLFQLLGMTAFDVCQLLSAVVFLILGLIVSSVAFIYLGKAFRLLLNKIPHEGVFGVISGVLGIILYLAIYFGVIIAVFGLIKSGATKEVDFFSRVGEFIKSCQICGWLYKINPLGDAFVGLFK